MLQQICGSYHGPEDDYAHRHISGIVTILPSLSSSRAACGKPSHRIASVLPCSILLSYRIASGKKRLVTVSYGIVYDVIAMSSYRIVSALISSYRIASSPRHRHHLSSSQKHTLLLSSLPLPSLLPTSQSPPFPPAPIIARHRLCGLIIACHRLRDHRIASHRQSGSHVDHRIAWHRQPQPSPHHRIASHRQGV